MYSFVYNKTRNHLVEKAKALVNIYTNSHLLCQTLGTDPVSYYNDNIFSMMVVEHSQTMITTKTMEAKATKVVMEMLLKEEKHIAENIF